MSFFPRRWARLLVIAITVGHASFGVSQYVLDPTDTPCTTGITTYKWLMDPYQSVVAPGSSATGPTLVTAEGTIRESFANFYDNPYVHSTHDVNFYVELDPKYQDLHSQWNAVESINGRLTQLMEMEWEIGYFATDYWPQQGDRVWMMGRHIWDCGHDPYHSELHPPLIAAFTSYEPGVFGANSTVGQDSVSHVSSTNVTRVHYRSQHYKFQWNFPVDQVFDFDVRLPAKPSDNAVPAYEFLDDGHHGPHPTLTWTTDPQGNQLLHFHYLIGKSVDDVRTSVRAGWHEAVSTVPFCRAALKPPKVTIAFTHAGMLPTTRPIDWNFWMESGSRWSQVTLQNLSVGSTGFGAAAEIVYPEHRLHYGDWNRGALSTDPLSQPVNDLRQLRNAGWKVNTTDSEMGKNEILALFHGLTPPPVIGRLIWNETDLWDTFKPLGDQNGQDSLIGQIDKTFPPDPDTGVFEPIKSGQIKSRIPSTYPFLLEETGLADRSSLGDFTLDYEFTDEGCNPVVTSLSTFRAASNYQIMVFGRHFDPVIANNKVSFVDQSGKNRIDVPAINGSDTWLTVPVPQNAGTGPLEIETPGGRISLDVPQSPWRTFIIDPAPGPKPIFAAFTPKKGTGPVEFVIDGANLEGATLDVGGIVASTSWTIGGKEFHAVVDFGQHWLNAGAMPVHVTTSGGTVTAKGNFNLVIPPNIAGSITVNTAGPSDKDHISLAQAVDLTNGKGALIGNQAQLVQGQVGPGLNNIINIDLTQSYPAGAPAIQVDTALDVQQPGTYIRLNGNTLQGKKGVAGITLSGAAATIQGPGTITGFDTAGIKITGLGVSVVDHVSITDNNGPGILVNSPIAYLGIIPNTNSPSDDTLETISGNAGPGVLFTGTRSQGSQLILKNSGPKNTVGVEISGGAGQETVEIYSITGNSGNGVNITGGTGGNSITIRDDSANGGDGVHITNSKSNSIALNSSSNSIASFSSSRIRGNSGDGVVIEGAGSAFNQVSAFKLGDKQSIDQNSKNGIRISSGANGNVLSNLWIMDNGKTQSSKSSGVLITDSPTTLNVIVTSEIGNTKNGGPQTYGVHIANGATNNLVGDLDWTLLNTRMGYPAFAPLSTAVNITPDPTYLLSNADSGVLVEGKNTNGNEILNTINGRDENGDPRPNQYGVRIMNANKTIVGKAGEQNIIDSNSLEGVHIEGDTLGPATGNVVAGSIIGMTKGNKVGIHLVGVCESNRIGGRNPGERNQIEFNESQGILFTNVHPLGSASGTSLTNLVLGNIIGISPHDDKWPNGVGIRLEQGTVSQIVGSTRSGGGNIVSGNNGNGIEIDGKDLSGNQVIGNRIGTDQAGLKAVANAGSGIFVQAASGTLIKNNLLSGSGGAPGGGNGIHLKQVPYSPTTSVVGNLIGVDVTGLQAVPNQADGIQIENSQSVHVGELRADTGNVISGNLGHGISLYGSTTNSITFNWIGFGIGHARLDNGNDGIYLDSSSSSNFIGDSIKERAPNRVSHNHANAIEDHGSSNHEQGNRLANLVKSGSGNPDAPTLAFATTNGYDVVASIAKGNYPDGTTIDILSSDADDASGHIASLTTANGVASATVNAPVSGNFYATATVPGGATSGASTAIALPAMPPVSYFWILQAASSTAQKAHAGDKQVVLLDFRIGSQVQDATLNELDLSGPAGITNATLWMDSNDSGTIDSKDQQIPVTPTLNNGKLVFTQLGMKVAAGKSIHLLVAGDIDPGASTGLAIQLSLAQASDFAVLDPSGNPADYIVTLPIVGNTITIVP